MDQQKEIVSDLIRRVLEDLERLNYSAFSVGRYRHCYNGLRRYVDGLGLSYYTMETGLDYIRQKYGIEIEGLCGKHLPEARNAIRSLQMLWDYSEYGGMVVKMRPGRKAFECPAQCTEEYAAFIRECETRKYTTAGKMSHFNVIRRFLLYLDENTATKSLDINPEHVLKFITSYSGCSTRYLATIVSVLKGYFKFLMSDGFTTRDLSLGLPKIKITRGGFLPSSWKQEDVRKMLDAIDRNNPEGKRDYAILLIVARLGLRVGDIRLLKLSNLNWGRKEISIITQGDTSN